MPNPTIVTLDYTMPAAGSISLAKQVTRVQTTSLYSSSVLKLLGVTVQSDVTTAIGTNIRRRVIFNLLPVFFTRNPNSTSWPGVFIYIFKNRIGKLSRLRVTAAAPVFA